MPDKPFEWVPKENLLSLEELFDFVKIAIDEGVNKIRITGGEPLLRHDLSRFVSLVANYAPDIDLALTTNGFLLKKYAKALYDAGLKRVNISLDSLNPQTVMQITKKDVLQEILEGIDAALACGLRLKLNMVPLKGINDDEILSMLEYCKNRGIMLRYIEYMENAHASSNLQGMHSQEILNILSTRYEIEDMGVKWGTASHIYKANEYEFGVIEPHKDDFCHSCNRIRLSAEGFLIPCLYFDEAKSIKESIQARDFDKAKSILRQVVRDKPEKNRWSASESEVSSRAFYETGG
jgi:cyclic pyranopterin phosphate synthase